MKSKSKKYVINTYISAKTRCTVLLQCSLTPCWQI